MSLSSLAQLAFANRRRQLEKKPVKPVLIKVANEPLQLIQDLMQLNIAAKTRGRPKKKPLERQQAVNDLTVALLNGVEKSKAVAQSNHASDHSSELLNGKKASKKSAEVRRKEAAAAEDTVNSSRLRPNVNKSGKPVHDTRGLREYSSALDQLEEEEEEEAESEDELRLHLSLSEDELTS
jgi:hypothetical protein